MSKREKHVSPSEFNNGTPERSQRIFETKGAADAVERTLDEAAEHFAWHVHAYVVMGNHFHLAVKLAEPNLSDGMFRG